MTNVAEIVVRDKDSQGNSSRVGRDGHGRADLTGISKKDGTAYSASYVKRMRAGIVRRSCGVQTFSDGTSWG